MNKVESKVEELIKRFTIETECSVDGGYNFYSLERKEAALLAQTCVEQIILNYEEKYRYCETIQFWKDVKTKLDEI